MRTIAKQQAFPIRELANCNATFLFFPLSKGQIHRMKQMRGIIALLALLACFSGCKKTGSDNPGLMEGTWELRMAQASIIPPSHYTAGNGNRLKFTGSNYEMYTNGQLVKSGAYVLVTDPTASAETCLNIQPGEFTSRIVYDGDNSPPKLFIQVSNNKLTFLSGCFAVDGGARKEYERL